MNRILFSAFILMSFGVATMAQKPQTLHDFKTTTLSGETLDLASLKGKKVMEISSGGTTFSKQVFDGTKGMIYSPMGNEPISGESLEAMKYQAIMNIELDYEKHGIKQELLGIETLNGKDNYKIEIKYPNGKNNTVYYDVESGLRTRSLTLTEEGITDYSDYRDVEGIKFPFAIKQAMEPQTVDLKVISVKINSKLKDNLFSLAATLH
ncbi:MAG: hypothetical protein U1C46_08230 [Bacteroidales bacterium]|nr:hypothetical protein [Bacteroidales bacterium]MDZ4204787.1 hypothetical protein [Bacteroidales bacterium]